MREYQNNIQLIGKQVRLDPRVGLFVTMNPGYAGRSNLPDNLKQLFRGIAMIKPNRQLICQVMLYSQGFRTAEDLSGKIVMLFELCADQLSSQSHYDFGLRALKSVLRSAGALKRRTLAEINNVHAADTADASEVKVNDVDGQVVPASSLSSALPSTMEGWLAYERTFLVKSICCTIVPKLVQDDSKLFSTFLSAVFPDATIAAPGKF